MKILTMATFREGERFTERLLFDYSKAIYFAEFLQIISERAVLDPFMVFCSLLPRLQNLHKYLILFSCSEGLRETFRRRDSIRSEETENIWRVGKKHLGSKK